MPLPPFPAAEAPAARGGVQARGQVRHHLLLLPRLQRPLWLRGRGQCNLLRQTEAVLHSRLAAEFSRRPRGRHRPGETRAALC